MSTVHTLKICTGDAGPEQCLVLFLPRKAYSGKMMCSFILQRRAYTDESMCYLILPKRAYFDGIMCSFILP